MIDTCTAVLHCYNVIEYEYKITFYIYLVRFYYTSNTKPKLRPGTLGWLVIILLNMIYSFTSSNYLNSDIYTVYKFWAIIRNVHKYEIGTISAEFRSYLWFGQGHMKVKIMARYAYEIVYISLLKSFLIIISKQVDFV